MKLCMNTAALVAAALSGSVAVAAASGGTDIIRAPSNWRGTLLEGTDALIATNKFGEPLFVQSGETVARMFEPAPVTGDRLAKEFQRLCIDTSFDETKLSGAAATSGFQLANKKVTVSPVKAGAPYEASVWHSPEARVQIWSGDLGALKNRDTLSRWRRGATAAPFNASRVLAPSCNVTVMAKDFRDPRAFLDTMSGIVGAQPAKAVTKADWADGHWAIRNDDGTETRVVYSLMDFDKSEQLLHVGIARLPLKK